MGASSSFCVRLETPAGPSQRTSRLSAPSVSPPPSPRHPPLSATRLRLSTAVANASHMASPPAPVSPEPPDHPSACSRTTSLVLLQLRGTTAAPRPRAIAAATSAPHPAIPAPSETRRNPASRDFRSSRHRGRDLIARLVESQYPRPPPSRTPPGSVG